MAVQTPYLGRTLTRFLVFLVAQLVKNPPAMQETPVQFLHQKVPLGKDRLAQMVKNPPAMWEIWVRFLDWEDTLEGGMASHSSIPAWRIPMNRGAWWATVHGITKSRTQLSTQLTGLHMRKEPGNTKVIASGLLL